MTSLPDNLFSPTFKQQKLGLLFTAIMAIMVYLATLAMALQVGISSTSLNWDQSQQGRLSVEIPVAVEGATVTQPERIKQTLAALATMTEIKTAQPLADADIAKLLKPWISDANLLKTLPLPSLIDIQLKADGGLSAQTLKERLIPVVPDVHVDDHADWLVQLHHIVRALTALGWLLIALTGVALVIAISLICRAALAIEQKTIELLHIMGASDRMIAETFACHAQHLSWPAAVLGFSLAMLTVGGLGFLLQCFMISGTGDLIAWLIPASTLLVVPCLAILGAVVTARVAVLNLLKNEP